MYDIPIIDHTMRLHNHFTILYYRIFGLIFLPNAIEEVSFEYFNSELQICCSDSSAPVAFIHRFHCLLLLLLLNFQHGRDVTFEIR